MSAEEQSAIFDLENPIDRQRLSNPMRTLGGLEGLVVLDEIQRQPELFEVLRVLVDRPDHSTRFLVLGSASPRLVTGVSETLAGRVGTVDLSGFLLAEVGPVELDRLWLRGRFPRSFLAADEEASFAWREAFVRTFLERDIPQLGISIPAEALRRFGFELKLSEAPTVSRSMRTAITLPQPQGDAQSIQKRQSSAS